MHPIHRVALKFHEWVYDIALDNRNTDSRGVQHLIAFWFAENFLDYSAQEVIDTITDSGVFTDLEYKNTPQKFDIFGESEQLMIYAKNYYELYFFPLPDYPIYYQDKAFKVSHIKSINKDSDSDEESYNFEIIGDVTYSIMNKDYTFTNSLYFKYNKKTREKRLSVGELKGRYTISGYPIYKKLTFNGVFLGSYLADDVEMQGGIYKKDSYIVINQEFVKFHFGDVKSSINGIGLEVKCKNFIMFKFPTSFIACRLAENYYDGNNTYRKDFDISFHENGIVQKGVSIGNYLYQKNWYSKQRNFFQDGHLHKGKLVDYANIDGIPCNVINDVTFNKSHQLESCTLEERKEFDVKIGEKEFSFYSKKGARKIKFYENPRSIRLGCVKRDAEIKWSWHSLFWVKTGDHNLVTVQGIKWGKRYNTNQKCTLLEFHPNQQVKRGFLGEDIMLNGILYKAGIYLNLNMYGEIDQDANN